MHLRIAKGEVNVTHATRSVPPASGISGSRGFAARERSRARRNAAIGDVSVRKTADSNAQQCADPRRSEGQARYRRVAGGARNDAASGRRAPPGTPPCALRNVADSRRNGGADGERYELPSRARLRGFRAFERGTRNQECGHNAGDVFCGGGGSRGRVLTKAETRRSVLRAE